MRATVVVALLRAAPAVVRGRTSERACSVSRLALRSSSTLARARFATVSVLARTETRRSEGPDSGASAGHMPASASIERPAGVPMTPATSATPASCLTCSATRMRSIESKYEFRRTAHARSIPTLRSSHYSQSVDEPVGGPGSAQADHHEAALLEIVVDVPALLLTRVARRAGLAPWRQDPPVHKNLDVRHAGEDSLEVAEELRAVARDHDDHLQHRVSPSENLPNRADGARRCLETTRLFAVFVNGIANAPHSIREEKMTCRA